MCGIVGILDSRTSAVESLRASVRRMSDSLVHRGPDDSDHFVDARGQAALGFRRLAIMDLSEHGRQPMRSPSGRFRVVFNGEIFNHGEIRAELTRKGYGFRGHSDTEVMVAAFDEWGIEPSIRRFVGMFAIGIWDERERELTLVRDRLGIKPVFIHRAPGIVTFGSELKAIVAGPAFDGAVDTEAADAFLRYLYVPAPRTIYRSVSKLLPGHLITLRAEDEQPPESRPYWSLDDVAAAGLADPFRGTPEEAVDEVDALLREAVRIRMEADVPLGALLSGGIDSTTVVALMQEQSTRPVRTFSIAFDAPEHNEAHHAAEIARFLGTRHTEMMVTGVEALGVIPRLPEIFDEPHADASQIPSLLICQVARREVTVALSGDGGDEVFGGYNRYTHGEPMIQRLMRIPRPARRAVAAGINTLSVEGWNRAHGAMAPMLPSGLRHRLPGEKLHKLARMMGAKSHDAMYGSLITAWQSDIQPSRPGADLRPIEDILTNASVPALLDRMLLADQRIYLPDDQMAKIDRVSMSASLEMRVPLLDHRLVELAWRMPSGLKVRGKSGKWLLRQVLHRRVPAELVDRPKMGFSVPLAAWLRGPLRDWAEDLLDERTLRATGYLNTAAILSVWQRFLKGRDELALGLWAVLTLVAWHRRWIGRA